MNDKFFLDSNVCIYAFDQNTDKKEKAIDLILSTQAVISTQVLMETANVALKKLKLKQEDVHLSIDFINSFCTLQLIGFPTIKQAFQINQKYQYSLYDALIVAAALESDCSILYSEDMQHRQTIDKRISIINPFL